MFRYGEALPAHFVLPASFRWVLAKDLHNNPFSYVEVHAGDRVMDCGAAVGTFSVAALEAGASVRAFEPLPKNAAILRDNVAPYGERADVIEAALIPGPESSVWLAGGSGFPGTHSICSRAKVIKQKFLVPALMFREQLIYYQPNVLKLDIEGGEYLLMPTLKLGDLASVHCVFIEFHPFDDREARIFAIARYLQAEGLKIVHDRKRAFTARRLEAS